MADEGRRRLAIGLVAAAVTVAAATVVAGVDGGPGRGGHVHLWPLSHPFLGVAVAGVLVAVATRRAVRVVAALIAVAALGAGVLVRLLPVDRPTSPAVAATSADLSVVSYRSPGLFRSDAVVLRLRTREGLASREGTADIACFIVPSSGAGPEWVFGRVEFTGRDEVAVHARDGTMWRIRVDPRKLTAAEPVDRCSGAPDIMGD